MFTASAFLLIAGIGWYVSRKNNEDRRDYDASGSLSDWMIALHTRQDIKLIAFLLAGIVVMLGVIADRLG